MYDRFNREITYLRISVTDRCNLRCTYCMPSCGVDLKSHHDMLTFEEITEIARVAVGLGIRKIRLTGGEPLVRRGIVELVRQLAAIEGLETLAMTTNGILLPRYARDLRAAGLQAVNISLDTLDAARYREMTRGGRVEDAVAGVDAAIVAGFRPIKINVVVPEAAASDPGAERRADAGAGAAARAGAAGFPDVGARRDGSEGPDPAAPATTAAHDLAALRSFCDERGIILQKIGLYHLDRNKVDYEAFDRPPKCDHCNRLRLTSDGKFKPCLHSNHEFAVDFADIEGAILAAVAAKPFRGTVCTNRSMVSIGG